MPNFGDANGAYVHEIRSSYWINAYNPLGKASPFTPCLYYTQSVGYAYSDNPMPAQAVRANTFARPSALVVVADGIYAGQQGKTRPSPTNKSQRVGYRHAGNSTSGRKASPTPPSPTATPNPSNPPSAPPPAPTPAPPSSPHPAPTPSSPPNKPKYSTSHLCCHNRVFVVVPCITFTIRWQGNDVTLLRLRTKGDEHGQGTSRPHHQRLNPQQCGGRPCIRGMRIRVSDVLDLLATGLDAKGVVAELPDLELADVFAVLQFGLPPL